MKKILLACLFVLAGISVANAALSHVNAKLDSTHTSFTVEINTDSPDSAVKKLYLYAGKYAVTDSCSIVDSVVSSITDPDTVESTGLDNGVTYYFFTVAIDSVSTDSSSIKSIVTLNLTQTIADYDSSHTSLSWKTDYSAPDSGIWKIVLLCDKNNPPTTRKDSVTAGITDPDSLKATALDQGVQYFARFLLYDSAFVDTSAVDSATTQNITQTVTAIDSQYTSVKIQVNPANPDSGFKQYTLLLDTSNPPTTHKDSVTASLTDPDTLTATGLTEGAVVYYFRVIVADSACADTSSVGSTHTLDMTQTLTVVDTTVSYFKVQINPSAADSAFKKIVLLVGTSSPPTTHVDSVTSGCTDPDSLQYVGGTHFQTYYYRSIVTDSTHTDTSGIGSIKLEKITFAISVYDTTYRNFFVEINQANVDSALKKMVLEIQNMQTVPTTWTRIDSVTTVTDPDTLQAAPAPWDLTQGSDYPFRIIATDSTGTDTSATDTITADSWSVPTDYLYPGSIGSAIFKAFNPGLTHYRISWYFNESGQGFVSDTIDITGYDWMKFSYRIWGEDNNHTFDSLVMAVYSQTANALVVSDTITNKAIDTLTISKSYLLRSYVAPDSSGGAQTSIYDWNYNMWFELSLTDSSAVAGDTMNLDPRYLVGDLVLRKSQ